jgi:hypothetical protein
VAGLTTLQLDGNFLGEGCKHLWDAVAKGALPNMKLLNLCANQLDDECLGAFDAAMSEARPKARSRELA